MGLAIHNLIESVCNPSGRFKMLDGIRVKTDSKGDPVFLYKDRSVCFWVDWNGNGYVLKCFLHCQESDKASLQQIAEYLEGINSPFLVDYVYLNDEMLVFDDSGNSYYIDVVLMGYSSEMVPMDEFLDRAAKRGDRQAVERLLDDFCRMAVWLINDRIVHGAIRASNVLVASDGTVRLINYESMRIPPSGSMHGSVIDNDNIVVANLALALRVLRDDPSLFYTLRGNSMFRLPILRSSLLPMFAHAAQKSGCVPMQALVEMLSTCNHTLHSRRELSEVLEALTADRTPVTVDLSKIAIDSEEETYMHEMACENERKLRDNSFKAQYSWVGEMSEALTSAEQNGKWGYIDGEGRVVLPFQYKWASDFAEGRAVVVAPSGTYALIDKTGREILPAMYELMEWDAVHGVVKVSYEGVFGLADRNGTEIVPLQYDWMGDTDNSLILVRDEAGRCGYIRHDGKQAIALQYDDAYDFDEQNKALVVLGDRSFYIDLEGNELFEADEMKVAR